MLKSPALLVPSLGSAGYTIAFNEKENMTFGIIHRCIGYGQKFIKYKKPGLE